MSGTLIGIVVLIAMQLYKNFQKIILLIYGILWVWDALYKFIKYLHIFQISRNIILRNWGNTIILKKDSLQKNKEERRIKEGMYKHYSIKGSKIVIWFIKRKKKIKSKPINDLFGHDFTKGNSFRSTVPYRVQSKLFEQSCPT